MPILPWETYLDDTNEDSVYLYHQTDDSFIGKRMGAPESIWVCRLEDDKTFSIGTPSNAAHSHTQMYGWMHPNVALFIAPTFLPANEFHSVVIDPTALTATHDVDGFVSVQNAARVAMDGSGIVYELDQATPSTDPSPERQTVFDATGTVTAGPTSVGTGGREGYLFGESAWLSETKHIGMVLSHGGDPVNARFACVDVVAADWGVGSPLTYPAPLHAGTTSFQIIPDYSPLQPYDGTVLVIANYSTAARGYLERWSVNGSNVATRTGSWEIPDWSAGDYIHHACRLPDGTVALSWSEAQGANDATHLVYDALGTPNDITLLANTSYGFDLRVMPSADSTGIAYSRTDDAGLTYLGWYQFTEPAPEPEPEPEPEPPLSNVGIVACACGNPVT